MPPQSPAQPGAKTSRRANPERRESSRARRRAEQEEAARRKRLLWVGGAVAAALAVAIVLILLNRPQDVGAPIVAAPALPESIPASGSRLGAEDAPVELVEWGDYQCPGCGIFAQEIEPRLIEQYVEPGEASFEFRAFSFLGDESFRAAEAAACAADQGAFWRYHDTLYANQRGENQNAFSDVRLKEIARVLALDTAAFNECLDSGEKRAEVEASAAAAREAGINSTPTFLVNGTRVEDWRNWDAVSAAIDSALEPE